MAHLILRIGSDGIIYSNVTQLPYGIKPVLYLKENTYISGGSGTSDAPYTLSLNE